MPSRFTKFFKSRTFIINICLLLILLIVVGFSISGWLSHFTLHGESISVPNLSGIKINKVGQILADNNLQYKVVDSLYDLNIPPGAVLDQDPAPKSKVKENRTIYLTINASNPPNVKMPDLVDVSYRQATAMLESFGLVVGEISYKTDLAKNAVLEQRYRNSSIKAGTKIPKGSEIDLVLGDGLENLSFDSDVDVAVPDLIGKTYKEALSELRVSLLAVGIINYDDVADSADAVVYKQYPLPSNSSTIKAGHSVDLYLR